MEFILHIGMGKTGTTAIQKALAENAAGLRAQGIDYLGMMFDLVDPSLRNNDVQRRFFASSTDRSQELGDRFLSALRQRQTETGVSKFLISNESLFELHKWLSPFLTYLKDRANLRLVAYARDPRDWLPSAYNQWFIYDKTNIGPIPTYPEGGRRLLKMYQDLNAWAGLYPDLLTVRPFEKSTNVVADFASVLGVDMPAPTTRTFERVETSESILRAIYNSRLEDQALPDRFDRAFRRLNFGHSPDISTLLRDSFSYESTDEIVAEQGALFAEIKERLGLDLLAAAPPEQKTVDTEAMRNRLLEHLLHIVMQQADRITQLEQAMRRLERSEKPD